MSTAPINQCFTIRLGNPDQYGIERMIDAAIAEYNCHESPALGYRHRMGMINDLAAFMDKHDAQGHPEPRVVAVSVFPTRIVAAIVQPPRENGQPMRHSWLLHGPKTRDLTVGIKAAGEWPDCLAY